MAPTHRRNVPQLCDGLKWFAGADFVEPMSYPFHSMSAFVVARLSASVSACSSRHSQWPSYCKVLGFKVETLNPGEPMWVYVRHDRTEVAWDRPRKTSDATTAARLQDIFGIAVDKVSRWRSLNGHSARDHAGMAGTEQLDCYFRITALNRQIASLEAHRDCPDPQHDALLVQQRQARDALIATFNRQAFELFG